MISSYANKFAINKGLSTWYVELNRSSLLYNFRIGSDHQWGDALICQRAQEKVPKSDRATEVCVTGRERERRRRRLQTAGHTRYINLLDKLLCKKNKINKSHIALYLSCTVAYFTVALFVICPESESEFSNLDESEEEEYTAKRKREKKKTAKSEKRASVKAVKKEKSAKPAKTKPQSRGLYTFFQEN